MIEREMWKEMKNDPIMKGLIGIEAAVKQMAKDHKKTIAAFILLCDTAATILAESDYYGDDKIIAVTRAPRSGERLRLLPGDGGRLNEHKAG